MSDVPLTLAISDYDHVRDLTTGRVPVEGVRLTCLNLSIEEIFYRFTRYREWEVSEMSLAKYVSLVSTGDAALSSIPVFPSRIFRQSSIYIRDDTGIDRPEDLAGRKVGIPEWAQTAGIYTRGWLMHQVGLALQDVHWCQAGVNQPGRVEKVDLSLPSGVRYESYPTRSLSDMLLDGTIDAAMTAHPPACFKRGDPGIRRLFEDFQPVEEAYWRETGIFPIMHTIAIRSSTLKSHPWVAGNLLSAFEEAKRRSVARALEITAPRFPIPWCFEHARRSGEYFETDYWPYGVEANRTTLEPFIAYAWEQGILKREISVDDLFAPETRGAFKV